MVKPNIDNVLTVIILRVVFFSTVKGAGYCGVAHLRRIEWYKDCVIGAEVDLYVTPFTELNPVAKMTDHTSHRVRVFESYQSVFV